MKNIEIKMLRESMDMSQREFSKEFGIPLGTLRNWEQGLTEPPTYVYSMILCSSARDKTINIETLRFQKMLDELAKIDINDILSFKEATPENVRDKMFYDEKTEEIIEDSFSEVKCYRLIADCLVEKEYGHHDIISYYDSYTNEYKIKYVVDENEKYIEVQIPASEVYIIIEKGHWYFS